MLIIAINFFGYGIWMKNYFSIAAAPILKIFNNFSESAAIFGEKVYRINEIYRENSVLRNKNAELESEISNLREAKKENESLRQLLQFEKPKDFALKEAAIIGKSIDSISRYLIIDKGSGDGIKKGDIAIASNGILAGRVSEAAFAFSKIKIITSSDSAIASLVQETRTAGIVKGQFNISLMMDMINPGDEIKVGDHIITSGQDGELPKGLLIGKVSEVMSVTGNIFKTAAIDSILNFDELESIYILSKNPN